MEDKYSAFKEQLERSYAWPVLYTFKFIVPRQQQQRLRNLFTRHHINERPSGKGNYTAFTIQMMMPSSDAVIDVYRQAATIEGIISL